MKPRGDADGREPDFAVADVGWVPVDVQPARFVLGAGEGVAHDFCDGCWDTQFPGVGGLPRSELRGVGLKVGAAAEVVARCLRGHLFLDRASCGSGDGGLVIDACAMLRVFDKF